MQIFKGGVDLKRFTSGKQHKGGPEIPDQRAEDPTPGEEDAAIAANADTSAPQEPTYPLAGLAKKLDYFISASADAFFKNGLITKEDHAFWGELNEKAEKLLQLIDSSERSEPLAADTQLALHINYDWSAAYGLLIPPIGKGEPLSADVLAAQAEGAGIKYGLDTAMLSKMVINKTYFCVFQLASGKPVKNGADGRVEELFPREKRKTLEIGENEIVDFKNLNWLQCVHKGDVICNIFPPTAPEDGCDIGGNIIKGGEGRAPRLPRGKNIVESEDGSKLLADADGQLTFAGSTFNISSVVSINGNVDSAVGNLDVVGSINIKGSVLEGFVIKATSDIQIFGSVVGANLEAGGDVKINGGINGGSGGTVKVCGNLITKFIESTTVNVGGSITAESIISSTVTCGDKITALVGKGAIIGGIITSFKGIEAKVIGNERNLSTKMIVGCDPQLTQERAELKAEVSALTKKADETAKSIRYLEQMENADQLQQQLLNKIRLDFTITNMNLAKKSSRLIALEEELKGDDYQIVASHIYPPLVVTMGTVTQHFLDESRMSRIYKADGDIQLGMK